MMYVFKLNLGFVSNNMAQTKVLVLKRNSDLVVFDAEDRFLLKGIQLKCVSLGRIATRWLQRHVLLKSNQM